MTICVLVGFQGAGKTTMGRALGKRLEVPFFDLDEELVKTTGSSTIQQTFSMAGEARFRTMENEIALSLLRKDLGILSFGGGAVAPLGRIEKKVPVIYLFQPFERLCRAVMKQRVPLWIDSVHPVDSLQEKWKERHQLYTKHATDIISLSYASIEEDVCLLRCLLGGVYGK